MDEDEGEDSPSGSDSNLPPFSPRGNGNGGGGRGAGGAGAGSGAGGRGPVRGSGGGRVRGSGGRAADEGPAPSGGNNRHHPYDRLALDFVQPLIKEAVKLALKQSKQDRKCGCCGAVGFYRTTCGKDEHVCLRYVCTQRAASSVVGSDATTSALVDFFLSI